jgi:hypothetical protein
MNYMLVCILLTLITPCCNLFFCDVVCIGGVELGEFKFTSGTAVIVETDSSTTKQNTTFRSFSIEGGCSSNKKKRVDIGADSIVEVELWIDAIRQAVQRLPASI